MERLLKDYGKIVERLWKDYGKIMERLHSYQARCNHPPLEGGSKAKPSGRGRKYLDLIEYLILRQSLKTPPLKNYVDKRLGA